MELPNIPYSVSHRNVKYPRLEFRTGRLLLVLPFGRKPGPILDKHRKWILKKMAFVGECLKQASDKRMVERTEQEFRPKFLRDQETKLLIGKGYLRK